MSVESSFDKPRLNSFAGTAISDVAGNAVFNFGAAFPTVPVIVATLETVSIGNITVRIAAKSVNSCTVFVAFGTTSTPVAGETVHVFATEAGRVTP